MGKGGALYHSHRANSILWVVNAIRCTIICAVCDNESFERTGWLACMQHEFSFNYFSLVTFDTDRIRHVLLLIAFRRHFMGHISKIHLKHNISDNNIPAILARGSAQKILQRLFDASVLEYNI